MSTRELVNRSIEIHYSRYNQLFYDIVELEYFAKKITAALLTLSVVQSFVNIFIAADVCLALSSLVQFKYDRRHDTTWTLTNPNQSIEIVGPVARRTIILQNARSANHSIKSTKR